MAEELNPLDIRIQELLDATAMTHQGVPEWYRRLCIDKYIKEEEPELLEYTPTEISKLPLDVDNENIIKIPATIEETNETS